MTSIVIADDHELIREGVKKILRSAPGLRVAAEAADLAGLLAHIAKHRPDLVVLDISLPGHDGLEGLIELRRHYPEQRVRYLLGRVRFILANRDLRDDDRVQLGTAGHQIGVAIQRAQLYANMESLVRDRTRALQSERNLLADHGCDEMQGFFFSRPVPAEACEQLLRDEVKLSLDLLARAPYARTLLYVDDQVDGPAAVRRALRDRGYIVLSAVNVEEAFEIMATTEVGVVLCDQRTAGIDASAFLSRVRHLHPEVTRMVLPGWTDEGLDAALREAFAEYESRRAARH